MQTAFYGPAQLGGLVHSETVPDGLPGTPEYPAYWPSPLRSTLSMHGVFQVCLKFTVPHPC